MDIWFKKIGIQKICSQKAASQKRLGVKTALKLPTPIKGGCHGQIGE